MSQRNSRENKKRRRVAKEMRKMDPIPAYIDLIEYVKFRTRCTTGMAKKLILNDCIRIDSHILGYKWMMNEVQGKNVKVIHPWVSDEIRERLEFHMPNE